jgi:putative NADH-flavin reductase
MRLAIFGATGKTGTFLVEQALAAGHQVAVLARDPSKVQSVAHKRLRVVEGAADQVEAIAEVVRGADAVISAMGGGQGTLSTFGENVLYAMKHANVKRIVSLVGASVRQPGDQKSFGRTMLHLITRLIASSTLEDGERHARILAGSDLAYTLVRPPRLTDGPATGRIDHGLTVPVGPTSSISRADLATFMLRSAVDNLYIRQAPIVAGLS